MSVDTTVSVGVGFVVEPEAFAEYRKTVPFDKNYGSEEIMEMILQGNTDGLTYGSGGSYFSAGEIQHWIAVSRLTQSHDVNDIPGGVVGLSKTTITLAEREALNAIARKIGMDNPTIGQFMSVLWH